jgi:hypothetical protein
MQKANLHCGDICAIRPDAQPLIDLLSIEAKRGYPNFKLNDLVNKTKRQGQTVVEAFLQQAREGHKNSGSHSWMLIYQANGRVPIVFYPHLLMLGLVNVGAFQHPPAPFFTVDTIFREKQNNKTVKVRELIVGTTLRKFLANVTPDHIRTLAQHGL